LHKKATILGSHWDMVLFSFIRLLAAGFLLPDNPTEQKQAVGGKFRWPQFGMAIYKKTIDVLRDFRKNLLACQHRWVRWRLPG
jgi:hypothetical protein